MGSTNQSLTSSGGMAVHYIQFTDSLYFIYSVGSKKQTGINGSKFCCCSPGFVAKVVHFLLGCLKMVKQVKKKIINCVPGQVMFQMSKQKILKHDLLTNYQKGSNKQVREKSHCAPVSTFWRSFTSLQIKSIKIVSKIELLINNNVSLQHKVHCTHFEITVQFFFLSLKLLDNEFFLLFLLFSYISTLNSVCINLFQCTFVCLFLKKFQMIK